MEHKVHLVFSYDPEQMNNTAWLDIFAYQGKLYSEDEERVTPHGEDSEALRSTVIQKLWPEVEELENIRLGNVHLEHPESGPRVILAECLRDEMEARDADFLKKLPAKVGSIEK